MTASAPNTAAAPAATYSTAHAAVSDVSTGAAAANSPTVAASSFAYGRTLPLGGLFVIPLDSSIIGSNEAGRGEGTSLRKE